MKKKWWLWIGLGVLVILGMVLAYAWNEQKSLAVETMVVEPALISKTITESGVVKSANQQVVTSTVSGKVVTLAVQEGQYVEAGDLLFRIETDQLSQGKAQAEKLAAAQWAQAAAQKPALDLAEKEVVLAQQHLDDLKLLSDVGAVGTTEVTKAEHALAAAQSTQEAALNTQAYLEGLAQSASLQVQEFNKNIAKADILADKSGYITDLVIKQGSIISAQTEACFLSDAQALYIEVMIQSEQAMNLRIGDPVIIKVKTVDEDLQATGQISEIMPYAIEKLSPLGLAEQRVPVKLTFSTKDIPLNLGYSADVILTLVQADQALAVPKSAVFAYETGYAVWLVKDGRAQLQIVEQGLKSTNEVVISNGLLAGDEVVVQGAQAEIVANMRLN